MKWRRKAAAQNLAEAQCSLGNCYAAGLVVVKNEVEAVKWYRKAAENGEWHAMNNLGWHLATSANPAMRDGSNAVFFAEKACCFGKCA